MEGSRLMLVLAVAFQILGTAFSHNASGTPQASVLLAKAEKANSTRQYDFIYFVQQWQISVCDAKPCLKPPMALFSIHELQPASYSGKDFTCNRNGSSTFHPEQISDLKNELDSEWPALRHEDNNNLWKQQWANHGVCSESVLAQHAYFEAALELKKKYVLLDMLAKKAIYPFGNFYTVEKITYAIKSATGYEAQVGCKIYRDVPLLSRIILCVDYTATYLVDCPKRRRCQHEVVLFPYELAKPRPKN